MRTVNGVTEFYAYDSGDKLLAVTGGSDPRTFAYDAAGRTTGIVRSSGTTAFSYDYESRVASITKPGMTTNTFTYNGLDTRVGMVDSSGSKSFKRNGVDVTDPVLSDGTASFTPSGEVRGGVKTTFHSSLKNDDVQSSASQVIGEAKVFDAFGNELSSTGAWKSQFGYAGKFGYQGDADSGLKLLGHRYYDSSTGRFLTRDPVKNGRNWFAYLKNNPINSSDPEGLAVLIFDGTSLSLVSDDGSGKPTVVMSVPAYSGTPSSTAADQHSDDFGPIPEGEYTLDPSKMETWEPITGYIKIPGRFTGNPDDWGHARFPIVKKTGNTTTRHSFFLHSGKWIGSIGCIDVPEMYMLLLVAMIIAINGNQPITLIVDYSGKYTGSRKKPLRPKWKGAVPGTGGGKGKGPTWDDYLNGKLNAR